jgi:hypothetical protein
MTECCGLVMVQAKTCCTEQSDYCPTVLIVQVVVRHQDFKLIYEHYAYSGFMCLWLVIKN